MKTFNLKVLLTNIINKLLTAAHNGISIVNTDINATIAASSYTTTMLTSNCPTVSNYTARCIVGYNIYNQDGGANSSFVFPFKIYINQTDQTINVALRNMASAQAKITIRVFILYSRNVA